MTPEQCLKWVQGNLPFMVKRKRAGSTYGIYPFAGLHTQKQVEEGLAKELYKLLNETNFVILNNWGSLNAIPPSMMQFIRYLTSERDFFRVIDKWYSRKGNAHVWTIDEIFDYWMEHGKGQSRPSDDDAEHKI